MNVVAAFFRIVVAVVVVASAAFARAVNVADAFLIIV